MVFDVESIGLHGEGYAAGYVVVDGDRQELQAGRFACDPRFANGTWKGREWVAANVPPLEETHLTPHAVRDAFWGLWQLWKGRGAVLAADCPWPVEARFLAACVDDARGTTASGPRDWEGPYPLVDVASVRLAAGLDPLGAADRLPSELPAHDPLADARQSARLLTEALALAVEG